MIKVSVIIPVYNVEDKIERCIKSLLQQSFKEFEMIFIDDGSTDKSGEICEAYAKCDDRITVIHKVNEGVSIARNIGIQRAVGSYLTFVDSDDYVEKDYLKVLYEAMLENLELSICGVYFCRENCYEKTQQKNIENYCLELNKQNEKKIAEMIQDRRFNYVYGKMYSKAIIDQNRIRFDKKITLGEDTIFVMNYLKYIKKCEVIGAAYYNYIKYANGTLTHTFYEDIYQRYTYINNSIKETFKETGLWGRHIQNAIDQRQLESFGWAISFVRNSNLKKKKKIEVVEIILDTLELQEALERHPEEVEDRRDYQIAVNRLAEKLLNYYSNEEKKEKFDNKVKRLLVKIVPRKIIKKVKEWR